MLQAPLYPVRSPTPTELSYVSFFPNGSSAVVQTTIEGFCTAVTRTGVGVFTIVLPDIGIFTGAIAELRGAVAADIDAKVGTWVGTTRTLTITLFDVNTGAGTGAAADVAAQADSQVVVQFLFKPTLSR